MRRTAKGRYFLVVPIWLSLASGHSATGDGDAVQTQQALAGKFADQLLAKVDASIHERMARRCSQFELSEGELAGKTKVLEYNFTGRVRCTTRDVLARWLVSQAEKADMTHTEPDGSSSPHLSTSGALHLERFDAEVVEPFLAKLGSIIMRLPTSRANTLKWSESTCAGRLEQGGSFAKVGAKAAAALVGTLLAISVAKLSQLLGMSLGIGVVAIIHGVQSHSYLTPYETVEVRDSLCLVFSSSGTDAPAIDLVRQPAVGGCSAYKPRPKVP